ncbi:restriction system-associated AAA family ATPase [bacterium]|nr:restriction system-associated AAA family ATPase [bacterium]
MKLLKLKIDSKFRSIDPGFSFDFRTEVNGAELVQFQPYCLAGLNGSGKSNVLEALANIFYHLELCANLYKPDVFKYFFTPSLNPNGPDTFELEYLTFPTDADGLKSGYNYVRIRKSEKRSPKMWKRFINPGEPLELDEEEEDAIDLFPRDGQKVSDGKGFLPELVVGYSSGENEILSIPFLKSRLIRLDEHSQLASQKGTWEESTHSLVYVDAEMSQAVLLACLLFEDDKTLEPLEKELGVMHLRSFRMHINDHRFKVPFDGDQGATDARYSIFDYIKPILDQLKNISTSWYEHINDDTAFIDKTKGYVLLDFYVDDVMKKAFRKVFDNSAIACFRFFQHLYELNNHFISNVVKEHVYDSKGLHTDGKMPIPGPEQKAFYFLDFLIHKRVKKEPKEEFKDLLLRNFSDGEHQFLHTMGICLLLKDRRTLMLLDEPETHFNPDWRSKFIRVLAESIKAGGGNNLLKDILITSHSPFIISDCLPNNVFVFKRDAETNGVMATSAREMDFNTYGAGVDLILQEVFGVQHSISEKALEEIKTLIAKDDINEILRESRHLNESFEKGFLYERIAQLREQKK